jgi:hypothetical protein
MSVSITTGRRAAAEARPAGEAVAAGVAVAVGALVGAFVGVGVGWAAVQAERASMAAKAMVPDVTLTVVIERPSGNDRVSRGRLLVGRRYSDRIW